MDLFAEHLATDAGSPRLTVYDERQGSRLDFSAQTLDNWAAKVANMLVDELDLEDDDEIALDLPVGWQCAAIVLGALASGVGTRFGDAGPETAAVFSSPERAERHAEEGLDVAIVTDDPFGRGVIETGGELPLGAIDFGPTVRLYGDQFPSPTRTLAQIAPSNLPEGTRLLSTGWSDEESFRTTVLEPLGANGSAVVVAGLADAARLDAIAKEERVTARA
ncbi:TIGR03089 family protein [Corynebacterium otitidis]|nr:TIGR03089 family protein [Corynebacterium otitidis]KKO84359.1 hypothetical protein AAV33_01550 [Corynebacterium otitidis]